MGSNNQSMHSLGGRLKAGEEQDQICILRKNLFGCNMRTDQRKASEDSGEPRERTIARERSGNGGKEK